MLIVPLTKRKADGTLYQRPDIIEPLLAGLANLPRNVLLERARIRDRKHPDYLPSECLLYFVRRSRRDNSDAWFEQLYKILIERVLRSVPRAEISKDSSSLSSERIRNAVFDRFVEMLAKDRKEPDDKLDFFEVRFDLAVKRLRLDAQDRVWQEESRTASLDDESSGTSDDAAQATTTSLLDAELLSDPLFRTRFHRAIEALPIEQRRTIHLLLSGWQIDSSDPSVMTIVKALKCSEKTVRNYRDRALKALGALFNPGDDQ